jgi:hypothetical protein
MLPAILLALALAAPSASGRPSVTTKLSPPSRLTVGDRFELTLVVRAPHKSLVAGPLADSMGVFAVGGEKRKSSTRGDVDESVYRMSMAGFKPGRHPVPVFTFIVDAGQRVDTLRSDTASVTIASVLPPTMQDIHGLAPPETFPNPLVWIVPALLLLAAVLAFLGYRLYRRLRTLHELGEPPLPPWEEALQALDGMPWREWLETGQVKRYYYALSQVLKRYMERRFEFDAMEQTTTEILHSMRSHKTPMRDEIGKFFSRYDLVKYAKWEPPMDEAELAIGQVRDFVVRTKPQEPATPTAPVGTTPAPAAGRA